MGSTNCLPLDPLFSRDIINSSSSRGLSVYKQYWQDRQSVDMTITHLDFKVDRDWLRQMGNGTERGGVTVHDSSETGAGVCSMPGVRKIRVCGDNIVENWDKKCERNVLQLYGIIQQYRPQNSFENGLFLNGVPQTDKVRPFLFTLVYQISNNQIINITFSLLSLLELLAK